MRMRASALLLTMLVALGGCAGTDQADGVTTDVDAEVLANANAKHPVTSADAREYRRFTSLQEMQAGSELVVVANVVETGVGRTIEGDGVDRFTMRNVHIVVEQVLAGQEVSAGSRLLVEEEGWTASGIAYSLNDSKWANVADRAIFFLVRSTDSAWTLSNSQSRFFLGDDGTVWSNARVPDQASPFIQAATALRGDALVAAIDQLG